ncbi:MAG: LysR family transcriptional regulator [Geminocystis sp.]|nr:LysR family transcriptional regulator [Geminocystis sp.]MCX8079031.1 LysR family transcriptional regulator [Geminocystis sp.]MDW8115128.1 LysR family transcriptional regulator [Geminocystis sp.]MDW8464396.1 LysR family transcriptional regulator [Geminocystis sp.]
MRLDQLRSFLAVAETGSFQAAAQRCGVSQPTISRQIQALEQDLGIQLLHRSGRARLTVAGDLFFRRARKIWQEWQAANVELKALQNGQQTELCVAAIHSICRHFLPSLLPGFYQAFPQIQLRVTALGSDRALKVLQDGLVDLAIVMGERHLLKRPEWVIEPLYAEPVQVLMAAHHPLAKRESLTWKDLAVYPHVVFKEGYGMRRLVAEEFGRRQLSWQPALELNTPEAFVAVIRESDMVSLLPRSALKETVNDPTLVIRELDASEAPPPRQVLAITTRDRLELPPIAHLLNLISRQAAHECGLS